MALDVMSAWIWCGPGHLGTRGVGGMSGASGTRGRLALWDRGSLGRPIFLQ